MTRQIITREIRDRAVTAAKLADGVIPDGVEADGVTIESVDGVLSLVDGSVTTEKIADDAVTAAKIAADAVGSSEIAASAVTSSELGTDAVIAGKIADAALDAVALFASSVRPFPKVADATARDSTFASPVEGDACWVQSVNQIQVHDGTDWLHYDTDWVTYTPTLTNLTLGNGTRLARRLRQGPVTWVDFSFLLGSTSAVGTTPTVSLPFTALDPHSWVANTSLGRCSLLEAGVQLVDGLIRLAAGLAGYTIHVYAGVGATPTIRMVPATISATVPFTWGTSDRIDVPPFPYEMDDPYAEG